LRLNHADIALSNQVLSSGKLGLVHPHGAVLRYFDVAPGNNEYMHRTLSIDFAVCVEGKMELKLDSGETRIMEPGDVVIQRGTMHSWRNPSETAWCRLVAVMMPAKEFKVGEQKIEENLGYYGQK
jgi:quercetin dioxygenase-like cupin family protein